MSKNRKNPAMIRKLLLLSVALLLTVLSCIQAKSVKTVLNTTNQTLVFSSPIDFHITSTTPLTSSTINLNHEDAWLFFDNIRPSVVLNTLASSLRIRGAALSNGVNCRVTVYKHGAVVIPYSSSYKPLMLFTKDNFQGDSLKLLAGLNKNLGLFNNNIRSFTLKRGFMATLATDSDGTGYSRVFVAQDDDIRFSVLPSPLYGRISFIRVIPWSFVSKKGWCTTDGDMDGQAGMTESTWCYSWSADRTSTTNLEYVPIKQHLYWPGWSQINDIQNTTAVLGYNEPEHSEQHDEGAYSVATAISHAPEFQNSGLRIGSGAPTDKSWISSYATSNDAACYRLDFVAMHAYWGGLTAATWYSTLKSWYDATGRPLWITEWNNGANWTTETWPSTTEEQYAKQLTDIKAILNVLDTAFFVERYSIYNWVENKRSMLLNNALTPAGEYYKNNHPDLAYNPTAQVLPKTPSITTPTWSKSWNASTGILTFSITDKNAEMTDRYVLQKLTDEGIYKNAVVLPQRAYDLDTTVYTYDYVPSSEERTSATYRLKYEYLNGSAQYLSVLSFTGNTTEDYVKNELTNGDYHILNASTGLFLTNNNVAATAFTARTSSDNQVWILMKDTTGRYKITSKSSGAFLNESAQLSSTTYYPNWNTYELLQKKGSDFCAIQDGGSGGTMYWTASSTTVTGKGSSTMAGFPFQLLSTTGSGILPYLTWKNTSYRRQVSVVAGDTIVLAPIALNPGGSWLWSTGDTTAVKELAGISESGTYTVTYTLNGVSRSETYTLTVIQKSQLTDGYFHIINPVDSTRLTDIGTLVPTFLPADDSNPDAQIWHIFTDATTGRHSIYNVNKGFRFLNEYGRFTNSAYSANWNSYELYNKTGTDQYTIRNGGSSGTMYWLVASNVITGKGSNTLDNFPFCLQPVTPQVKVYPYINSVSTDSLAVLTGTAVELQPKTTLPGCTWLWDNDSTTQNRSVTQTGTYSVRCSLGQDTLTCRFKVEFFEKSSPTDGAYLIRNPQDDSYLTLQSNGIPTFQGKDDDNSGTQTWLITKDVTSSRYKIANKDDPSYFLDEYGRYNSGTYYPAWNSFNLYNQTGTNLYAIQNGGSAGTHYWKLTNSQIRGKGTTTLTGFQFELIDPYGMAKMNGSAAAIRVNGDYLTLSDSMLLEAGTDVVLKQVVGKTGGAFSWNTGETTDSLVLNNIAQSGTYTARYVLEDKTWTETFKLDVYERNALTDGLYYIVRSASNTYLTYLTPTLKPYFTFNSTNTEMSQSWSFQKDASIGRYKISPLKNASIFLDPNATFSSTTYSNDAHTYEIWHLTGSDQWGIRNAGTSGSAFWLPGASNITGNGTQTITFPFAVKEYTGPTTGLTVLDETTIHFGPNPIRNTLLLSVPVDAVLDILTLDGRKRMSVSCRTGQNEIATESLPAGSYLGILRSIESRTVLKLIKAE
jgi:hypothetical protein